MSGFKLLAIKPLKDCGQRFLKALKAGQLYQFYNNYKFEFDEEKIIKVTQFNNSLDLYSIERRNGKKLSINISTIVGKNGSGKSSIMELFFAVIYNFSMNRDLLDVDEKYENQELVLENLKVQIIYEFKSVIYVLDTSSIGSKKEILEISILSTKDDLSDSKTSVREFRLTSLLTDGKNKDEIQKFLLENLFYTIAINYSVYGLNSNNLGRWINPLFHKNDGYKAPIVINPMRTEGNFDINTELYLSASRLVANVIHPDYIGKNDTLKITEFQKVTGFIYTIKNKERSTLVYTTPENLPVKLEDFYLWNGGKESFLQKINSTLFDGEMAILLEKIVDRDIILTYIIRKLFRIAQKYDTYKRFLVGQYPSPVNFELARLNDFSSFLKFKDFKEYLELIISDESHITFKLKQAINFVKYNPLQLSSECTQINTSEYKIQAIELSKRIKKHYLDEKVINLLPPNIYDLDIELEDDKGNISNYNRLSSGEQQLIQSTQSIAYHLINLDSVFGKPKGDNRPAFKNINLMMDEIELYFHPDMQRKFIKYLLDAINRLELSNTESINMLLATHSPFILSDIPINNTLRLKDKGEPETEQNNNDTFGANIHDLLANDFFLEKGFIGEFAKKKIEKAIKWLNDQKTIKDSGSLDINDTNFLDKKNEIKRLIGMVGERILRLKMIEMLSELEENDDNYKELIREEIDRLNKLL